MSFSASRMLLRTPQIGRIAVRHASTTSEAANAASNAASKATSQASQGLSKVQSSAESGISKAAGAAGSALNSIGGRTGQVISFVQSMIPPTVYYGKVGLELAKIVARGQKMSPPNVQTFQTYGQNLLSAVKNPGANSPSNPFQAMRNIGTSQFITAGVVAAEMIGFFTVGEMVGRMKLIGYRSSSHGEHH
ncbi:P-loop containing nucleoside triphosphate hydrolase protein [Aureobasidium pullulans]|nr:P-loop containing nucleoside triphosphate hydrolase protein [Aureobasidium pullulans]